MAKTLPSRTAVALYMSLLILMPTGAWAEENATPQVSVQGEGYVEAVPDIVVIQTAVSHTADTLAAAKRQADMVANAVIRAANLHGIQAEDLQASKIHASPEYDWRDGERTLRGQRITREFQLTLRDVDRYGALIQALAEAEVSEINSIDMRFSDEAELANQALRKAIANARGKAEAMAAAFDTRLDGVVQVNENGGSAGPLRYEMRADFAKAQTAGQSDAALRIGKQRITRSVSAVFALQDR